MQKKENKQKLIEELKTKVQECKECPLGEYRLNPCFGNGSYHAELMFVGEGPGYDEDHQGEVFVGRAGKLLDRILDKVLGLKRKNVFITNIVKCHPMKDPLHPNKRGNDRPPSEEEANICSGLYLINQIKLIKPRIIVTLGSTATKVMLDTQKGITRSRNKVYNKTYDDFEVKLVCTYHPAYLLRFPAKKKEEFEDFKLIRSLL
ncbi:MAG: uracil-DNA glycosylase [Atribacterota bacterium]